MSIEQFIGDYEYQLCECQQALSDAWNAEQELQKVMRQNIPFLEKEFGESIISLEVLCFGEKVEICFKSPGGGVTKEKFNPNGILKRLKRE